LNQFSAFLTKLSFVVTTVPITLAAAPSPAPPSAFPDQASIRAYIVLEARSARVPPAVALFIVQHESHFDPTTTGDTDKICPQTGLQQRSRGLWQISDCYHPEVDDEAAYSVVRSTAWALRQILKNPNEWSSWRFRHKWYR
jgi:hypothetical protein